MNIGTPFQNHSLLFTGIIFYIIYLIFNKEG
jgi:hypothetical protein